MVRLASIVRFIIIWLNDLDYSSLKITHRPTCFYSLTFLAQPSYTWSDRRLPLQSHRGLTKWVANPAAAAAYGATYWFVFSAFDFVLLDLILNRYGKMILGGRSRLGCPSVPQIAEKTNSPFDLSHLSPVPFHPCETAIYHSESPATSCSNHKKCNFFCNFFHWVEVAMWRGGAGWRGRRERKEKNGCNF